MIQTTELSGTLHSNNVFGLLNNTDHRLVPTRITAVLAHLVGGDIKTNLAELGLLFDLAQGVGQFIGLLRRSVEDMKSDPLRTLRPDPR